MEGGSNPSIPIEIKTEGQSIILNDLQIPNDINISSFRVYITDLNSQTLKHYNDYSVDITSVTINYTTQLGKFLILFNKDPMFPGSLITKYRGVLFTAKDDIIYLSEPLGYTTNNNYLKFEALSQFQTNKLIGIDARYLVGFGLRDKLFAKNNLKIYAGSLYLFEIEKTTNEAQKASQASRLSFYLSTNFQLPNHIGEFSSVSYYQPNLHQFSDFRLSNQSSLSFRLGPKLAFKNNFNIYYDAFPPPEIAKLNWNFSNGISITF
jgi:hypothetical protein